MDDEQTIKKYKQLVRGMAKRYLMIYRAKNCYFASKQDLIQEGYIGVLLAIKKANSKNRQLGFSYVRAWIRQRMSRYCNQNMNLIRWPAHIVEDIKKRLDEGEYKNIGEAPVKYLEFDQLLKLHDYDHELPDPLALPGLLNLILERSPLACREKFILDLRAKNETLDQIGKKLGMTRERIRQLESESITIIRNFLFRFQRKSESALSRMEDFFTEEDLTKLEAMVSSIGPEEEIHPMSNWRSEHGQSYDVPDEICQLVREGVIQDLSWKNDTSPKFGKEDCEIYLWVEHPDEDKRELGGRRFTVSNGDKTVIETEEIDKAISFFIMEMTAHGIPIGKPVPKAAS